MTVILDYHGLGTKWSSRYLLLDPHRSTFVESPSIWWLRCAYLQDFRKISAFYMKCGYFCNSISVTGPERVSQSLNSTEWSICFTHVSKTIFRLKTIFCVTNSESTVVRSFKTVLVSVTIHCTIWSHVLYIAVSHRFFMRLHDNQDVMRAFSCT